MGTYINATLGYYEGDLIDKADIVVTERPGQGYVWSAGAWALPLATAQAQQTALLTAACAAAIVGGYSSSALGTPHTYPSQLTDQTNMMGSVTGSMLPAAAVAGWTTPFWCQDQATGTWAYQAHTAAQIQQAGLDGKAWVTTCQLKLAGLNAQIAAATTTAAVEAITW